MLYYFDKNMNLSFQQRDTLQEKDQPSILINSLKEKERPSFVGKSLLKDDKLGYKKYAEYIIVLYDLFVKFQILNGQIF